MNLIKLLDILALTTKAFKFLFVTNELLQFQLFNEIRDNSDDSDVDSVDETLMKND